MASTVFANNLAVATSTSGHYAVTIVDIRKVNHQVPTPLPNFIASEHIARNWPATVRFDDGKVWNEPVEVGDPPKSQPIDTWPGVKSNAINSYANGAPGAGSGNVFVTGKKVLCFSHKTEQNAKNSFGIITDKAGLDKLLKEFEDSQKKKINPDADGKTKSKGKGKGKTGKKKTDPPPPQPPPPEPPKPKGCAVAGFKLEDDGTTVITGGKEKKSVRLPSNKDSAAQRATIEVIAGSKLKMTATVGDAMCAEHALWVCQAAAFKKTGETAELEIPGGDARNSSGLQALLYELPSTRPVTYEVVLTAHEGTFNRTVLAFPKHKVAPFSIEVAPFSDWGRKWANLFQRTRLNFQFTFKNPYGTLSSEGAWTEEEGGAAANWWKCYCMMALKGELTFLDVTAELRYSVLNIPLPFPPLVAIMRTLRALNAICEWATQRSLIDGYFFIKVSAKVSVTAGVEWRKYYQGNFSVKPSAATLEVGGTGTVAVGFSVAALERQNYNPNLRNYGRDASRRDYGDGGSLVKGSAYVEVSITIGGKVKEWWPLSVVGTMKIPRPKLVLEITWDLFVLIGNSDPGAQDRSSWWGRLSSSWSDFKNNLKQKAMASLGGLVAGKESYEIEFGWDESVWETEPVKILG